MRERGIQGSYKAQARVDACSAIIGLSDDDPQLNYKFWKRPQALDEWTRAFNGYQVANVSIVYRNNESGTTVFCVLFADGVKAAVKIAPPIDDELKALDVCRRHGVCGSLCVYARSVYYDDEEMVIVMTFGQNIDGFLPADEAFAQTVKIWDVIRRVYERTRLVYVDAKPQNFVLGQNGQIQIIDFGGFSTLMGDAVSTFVCPVAQSRAFARGNFFFEVDWQHVAFTLAATCLWMLDDGEDLDIRFFKRFISYFTVKSMFVAKRLTRETAKTMTFKANRRAFDALKLTTPRRHSWALDALRELLLAPTKPVATIVAPECISDFFKRSGARSMKPATRLRRSRSAPNLTHFVREHRVHKLVAAT
jgi:hypothetical protein